MLWFQCFKKLINKSSSNDQQDIENVVNGFAQTENDILDNKISSAEIAKTAKFLKNKKAHRWDVRDRELSQSLMLFYDDFFRCYF